MLAQFDERGQIVRHYDNRLAHFPGVLSSTDQSSLDLDLGTYVECPSIIEDVNATVGLKPGEVSDVRESDFLKLLYFFIAELAIGLLLTGFSRCHWSTPNEGDVSPRAIFRPPQCAFAIRDAA
jgi:hypothetical protein